jgi:hypothetical protein
LVGPEAVVVVLCGDEVFQVLYWNLFVNF